MPWKDLPTEILQKIFGLLCRTECRDEDDDYENLSLKTVSTCIHICKNWKRSAQISLYRHLEIVNSSSLEMLLETIKVNHDIPKLVKSLLVNKALVLHEIKRLSDIEKLLSSLSRLETIFLNDTAICSPLLNVLLDSKLPLLRNIHFLRIRPGQRFDSPLNTRWNDFVTCTLLLRKQLETLQMIQPLDSVASSDLVTIEYNRLYDRLDQFEKLSKLSIWKHTRNGIDFMEAVTKSCRNLKAVAFALTCDLDMDEKEDDTTISNCKPEPNIKSLYCSGDIIDISRCLTYIIHKFPQLVVFSLRPKIENTNLIDSFLFNKLIGYLSRIPSFQVSTLRVRSKAITEAIGPVWRTFPRDEPSLIRLVYKTTLIHHDIAELGIMKMGDGCYTFIEYPRSIMEMEHLNIIKKHGSLIRSLDLEGLRHLTPSTELEKDMVFGQFVVDVFKYCPHLVELRLMLCTIKKIGAFNQGFNSKLKLDEFALYSCDIYYFVLEGLSAILGEIGCLDLSLNRYWDHTGKLSSTISINMPFTSIGELKISNHRNPHRGNRYLYVKLFIVYGERDRFYKHDFYHNDQDQTLELSNKEEYEDEATAQNTHIFIECKSLEKLEITYNQRLFSLIL